jgi:hypothetical protein
MANVIQALHDILRRESAKPEGKGESLEHATLTVLLDPHSKAMLSDELKRRAQKEYPKELDANQS